MDRLLARLEHGPDPEAPSARAAPKTELVTAFALVATQLLGPGDEPEEVEDEVDLLHPPDAGEAGSAPQVSRLPDDGAEDGP